MSMRGCTPQAIKDCVSGKGRGDVLVSMPLAAAASARAQRFRIVARSDDLPRRALATDAMGRRKFRGWTLGTFLDGY